jgi:DNA double-strand break repair helicase HerA and related ATPase
VTERFQEVIAQGYGFPEPTVVLGGPMLETKVVPGAMVKAPLAMLNRHGLVAGATGTGKTKTLQILAGQLSDLGVPCFVADMKGDVTGMAKPGDPLNPKVQERSSELGWTFKPAGHPVEFLSLSGKLGAQVRATVHSFGAVLLAKVMDLNETQTSVLSLVFKYCDDNQWPLLDLGDLRTTLQYLSSDEGKQSLDDYGGMSKQTVGVLLRAIVSLEASGTDVFFGEPEFDVNDLIRTTADGKGIVSVLELSDVMDKPRLFSTFMLWMLAQLYHSLPEVGDAPKPKLSFFFDEAHLLFADASDALMEQIELTVRLIRSKAVGVYFATQAPTDVPSSVLGQLGNRIQHALRAFTPDDADNLRKVARTFPTSDYYDVEKVITQLGIGEALVTVLTPKGSPSPLAATRLIPPDSSMEALDQVTFHGMIATAELAAKYGTPIDRQSAHEIITARIQSAQQAAATAAAAPAVSPQVSGQIPAGRPDQITMTPAQYEREVRRQAGEMARAQREAERQATSARRADQQAERSRQHQQEQVLRAGTRILTSRVGQDVIRGVFGTLFGRKR